MSSLVVSRPAVRRPAALRAAVFGGPAVLAPVLVLLSTRRDGLNLSPDSIAYLVAAHGVADGAGIVGTDGAPQSVYPPGLPWLLSVAAAHGAAVGAARVLNLVGLAVVVLGLGLVLDRYVRRSVAVAAAGAAAVAAPLLRVHGWLWSEPLYILLSSAFLVVVLRLTRTDAPATRWIGGAGLLAAAATLVRYAGISLLPVAAAVLLLRAGTRRQRLRGAAVFGIAYAVPVGAWLIRNVVLTGDPAGERAPNAVPAREVLGNGLLTLGRWVTPEILPLPLRMSAAVLLAVGVAVLAVAARRRRPADPRTTVLALLVGYVGSAFAVLFVMTAGANVNDLGPRLLSPLVVPLVALLAVAADLVLDRPARPWRAVAAAAMVALAAACLLPPTTRAVSAAGEGESAFNRGVWQTESTRRLAEAAPPGATVFSDDPWGVYFLTGREVSPSPRLRYHNSDLAPPHELDDLADAVRSGPTYLVWFDRSPSDYHYSPAQLADSFTLTPVEHTPKGTVYRVTPAG